MSMSEDAYRADGSDNRPSAYYEDGIVIFRASAVGGSSHVLAAALAEITPLPHTEKTKQYMYEGVIHEPAILSRVSDDGWLFEHIGGEQIEMDLQITNRIAVRFHPDGFATAREDHDRYGIQTGDRVVVEAKAMSRNVFETYNNKGFDEFYRYACQLSIQMLGTGLPGLFAIKNRDDGEVRWQVFHEPPVPMAALRKRLMLIEKGAREGNLNPLNEKCTMFPCVYHFLHDYEPAEVIEDEKIDSLAEMLDRARERRKQAEEIERQAREKMREYLGEAGKRRTMGWSVSLSMREPRVAYDFKRMEEDGVDLAKYEKPRGEPYPQLYVKRIGKGGKDA